MKKLLYIALFANALFASCGKSNPTNQAATTTADSLHFGAKITPDGAKQAPEIIAQLDAAQNLQDVAIDGGNQVKGFPTKVEGKVVSVCKSAQCWITMQTSDGKELFIQFRDHSFKVPTSIVDKNVVVEGNAYKSETSVDMLRHLAEDAGKTRAEIEAITNPEVEYKFSATGLVIKQ